MVLFDVYTQTYTSSSPSSLHRHLPVYCRLFGKDYTLGVSRYDLSHVPKSQEEIYR